MSTNLFKRLTRLLPTSSTLVGQVTAHHPTDDTSSVLLPAGLAALAYAPGVAVGSTITAKGRTVPVGDYALVRDGAIIARAPTGVVSDVSIGAVVSAPFGPPRLAAAATPLSLPGALLGTPYSQPIGAAWVGGYPPFTYTLASGALPAGLALGASTGVIGGTATAAATATLTVLCADSTRRAVTALPITIAAA
jgi:hypothetical protein